MSKMELQQAIKFFQSPAGQTVVAARMEHSQETFKAATEGQQIADEKVQYPAPVQSELDAFASTSAGKFFVGDELIEREPVRKHLSDLRSAAMAKCLAASR